MNSGEVVVLRVGHRPGRDDRITTHVGLTARALGANRFVLAADDDGPLRRVDDVTARFGGTFRTERVDGVRELLGTWEGKVAHLTMYGLPLQREIENIRPVIEVGGPGIVIVVGAQKVPFELYERADWNVGVTNQPHSEVASLALFLDRLFDGAELDRSFEGGTHRVVPQSAGKRVEKR